jgi:homoprotocatechuate degradation regulator HpaR
LPARRLLAITGITFHTYLVNILIKLLMKDFQRSLPMMLNRALDAVMPPFRAIFHEFGLTEQQWRVLRVLWENDGGSVNALTAATLISAPSLVGIIDRLERDGLVKRRRSDSDRRMVHIYVSAKGLALEQAVEPRVSEAYALLEQSIDGPAWRALYSSLDAIIAR